MPTEVLYYVGGMPDTPMLHDCIHILRFDFGLSAVAVAGDKPRIRRSSIRLPGLWMLPAQFVPCT